MQIYSGGQLSGELRTVRGCDGNATGSANASLQFDGLHCTRQTGILATTERVVALLDTVLNSDLRTDPEVDQCYRQPVKLNLTPTQATRRNLSKRLCDSESLQIATSFSMVANSTYDPLL